MGYLYQQHKENMAQVFVPNMNAEERQSDEAYFL